MSITKGVAMAARGPGQRGVTLIELVIFIVVVSIAVVGLLQIFTRTTASSADPQLRKQALAIAEAMLDEIEGARFTFCDPINDPAADTALNAAPFNSATNPTGCTRRKMSARRYPPRGGRITTSATMCGPSMLPWSMLPTPLETAFLPAMW